MALIDLDQWHEILQTLRRNKLRTFLTACGVFWGVFMLLVMLGFGRGLEKAVESDFKMFAYNTVFVWGQVTSKPWDGRQPGRPVQMTTDDIEAIRGIEGVDLALSRNFLGGFGSRSVATRNGKSESFGITSEEPEYVKLEALDMKIGRYLNPIDMTEARKVAVIGPRVVKTLFDPGEDPIGKSITINNMQFVVVGVYHTPDESGPRGDFFAGRIFVPRPTFSRAFATGNKIGAMAILVGGGRPSAEVEADVRAVLRKRHHVAPDDERAFGGFNREKEFRKLTNLFLAIRALTWFVGVLTLLAGAIGVSNIMMIAVAERTREIGIRKAIGATPGKIMAQIVAESTALTGLAGYLAVVVGVVVLEIAGRVVEALPRGPGPPLFGAPELELGKAVLAAVVLTVAGALAGLAPARAAVAVRPVEALAHE